MLFQLAPPRRETSSEDSGLEVAQSRETSSEDSRLEVAQSRETSSEDSRLEGAQSREQVIIFNTAFGDIRTCSWWPEFL